MHAGKINAGDIDTKLLTVIGRTIENSVSTGLGAGFATVDYSTPDAAMLQKLTADAWHFSAAKNYQELRDFTLALKDENGRARSFADFKKAANKINDKYNDTWLRTEYNDAINSSTMAGKWSQFQENAEDMPFLIYTTAGDSNVRDDHRKLDGIIRKMIDDFWRKYYPPNGHRCRCGARQSPSSTANETENIPNVDIPEMFQTNLAVDGKVFPKGHPYYKGVPQKVLEEKIQTLPANVAYRNVYRADDIDGMVDMHILHGERSKLTVPIAQAVAARGVSVNLLPNLTGASEAVRQKVISKTVKKGANPAAKVDRTLYEFTESAPTQEAISNAVASALKQADNFVIKITGDIDLTTLVNYLNEAVKNTKAKRYIAMNEQGEILIEKQ